MEKELRSQINHRVMDPNRLQWLLDYPDVYGDKMLDKLLDKCKSASETAWMFGFDEDLVAWLLVFRSLAWKHCDEIGSDPAKSIGQAAVKIAREVLDGLQGPEVEMLIEGAGRVAEGMAGSAEEKIVCVIEEIWDHGYQIADPPTAAVNCICAVNNYQEQSRKLMKLVDPELRDLKDTNLELRKKRK